MSEPYVVHDQWPDSSPEDDMEWWGCILLGPDGFECALGEPEDSNFRRDGSPVVAELNRLAALARDQAARIEELEAKLHAVEISYTAKAIRSLEAERDRLRPALERLCNSAEAAHEAMGKWGDHEQERYELEFTTREGRLALNPPVNP